MLWLLYIQDLKKRKSYSQNNLRPYCVKSINFQKKIYIFYQTVKFIFTKNRTLINKKNNKKIIFFIIVVSVITRLFDLLYKSKFI